MILQNKIYQVSPDQNITLQSNKAILNIAYSEENVASHTIFIQIVEAYLQGKTTLVICDNLLIRSTLEAFFEQSALQEFYLSFDPNSEVQWEKIRKDYKNFFQLNQPLQISESVIRDMAKLQLLTEHKNENALLLKSVDAILELSKPTKYARFLQNMTSLKPEDFNVESTLSKISKLVPLFKTDFKYDDPKFDIYNISNAENAKNILIKLSGLIEKMSMLFTHLLSTYIDFDTSALQEIQMEIAFIKHKIPIQNEEAKVPSSKNFFHFLKSKPNEEQSHILLYVDGLISKCQQLGIKLREYKPNEDIVQVLEEIERIVKNWSNETVPRSSEQISRINAFNYPVNSKDILDLEQQLQEVTHEINGLQIFKNNFEINTINFTKQLDIARSIEYNLEKFLYQYDRLKSRKEWMDIKQSCTTAELKLLDALHEIDPKSWVETFNYWYHDTCIATYELRKNSTSNHEYEQLVHSEKIYNITNVFQSRLQNTRNELDNILNESATLKEPLNGKKKKEINLLWKTLIKTDLHFIKTLYPIIIVHNDGLYDTIDHAINNLIYVNSGHINLDLLQFFETIKTFYHSDSITNSATLDFRVLNSYATAPNNFDWTYISAYKIAHILTQNLNPKVYQLRNGIIINYSTAKFDSIIKTTLHHQGLKQLDDKDNISSNILTLLLQNHGPNVIVTIDNSIYLDSELNSALFLEYLKKYGFIHINIESKEIARNTMLYLSDLKNDLNDIFF
ncbi:MAG: hypothetical protein R2774_07510 [Saprospiraceae bacterium]